MTDHSFFSVNILCSHPIFRLSLSQIPYQTSSLACVTTGESHNWRHSSTEVVVFKRHLAKCPPKTTAATRTCVQLPTPGSHTDSRRQLWHRGLPAAYSPIVAINRISSQRLWKCGRKIVECATGWRQSHPTLLSETVSAAMVPDVGDSLRTSRHVGKSFSRHKKWRSVSTTDWSSTKNTKWRSKGCNHRLRGRCCPHVTLWRHCYRDSVQETIHVQCSGRMSNWRSTISCVFICYQHLLLVICSEQIADVHLDKVLPSIGKLFREWLLEFESWWNGCSIGEMFINVV